MFGWIGPVGVLAMNHGWFFNNKEWIEYIILTVVLWLLMMTAIHEFDLRSGGWLLCSALLLLLRPWSMDKLLFWLGIGAAQKSAGSKPPVQRNWVVSLVVGALVAAVMIVGMFLLLVSQKLWA
jgi:hypothetical protein